MIHSKQYRTDYDEDADVLYISFGKPKKAIGIEMDEGDVVRVDPFSESVVGITIIDFKGRYGKKQGFSIDEQVKSVIPQILSKFERWEKRAKVSRKS